MSRRFSRTFLVSGGLTAAGIVALAAGGSTLKTIGVLLLVFASPVFAVSAVRHLLRGLLWRVGSRLLVSYLLVGVLPLPFLAGLVLLALAALSGQLGARRAVEAVAARATAMQGVAREVASSAPAAPLLARHAADLPRLEAAPEAYAWALPAPGTEGTRTVALRGTDAWILVAGARTPRGTALFQMPLGHELAEAVTRETEIPVRFSGSVAVHAKKDTIVRLDAGGPRGKPGATAPAAPPPGRGLLHGRWVGWFAPLPFEVVDPNGAGAPDSRAILIVTTSIAGELSRLFAGASLARGGDATTGAIVLVFAKVLGAIVVLIYLAAAAISAVLVLRIARAAKRLSLGIAAVEQGDFSHRATLRGRDQLAGLVEGFNEMAAHLEKSVSERARGEALERELSLARSLQRRLLPPSDFTFPCLEIVADFRPAAAIGGDFYHLLRESETRLSVVIADVSGHGLPTGIVMASAKASLSALAATGMDAPALLAHLDGEIRRSTEERTFVTLAHVSFDLAARTAAFTNAGHLYPWVVRKGGELSTLPNPARPLGVSLPATFRTVTAPLEAGDLWVLCSDGIVEARSPAGVEFGFDRLERILAAAAGATAADLSSRILDAWRAHTGGDEPEDDRTLLVLRVA